MKHHLRKGERVQSARKTTLNLAVLAMGIFLVIALTGCVSARKRARGGMISEGRTEARSPAEKNETIEAPSPAVIRKLGLGWPLKRVRVTSRFGRRGERFHDGVDLKAESGTFVYAAQSGVVIYAGNRISGYGKLIVLRHPGGVATVYAHNSRLKVLTKQKVRKGQVIAHSGNTGHSSGPHLHFEVRRGTLAMDPMKFLAQGAPPQEGRRSVAAVEPPAPSEFRRPKTVTKIAKSKKRPQRPLNRQRVSELNPPRRVLAQR